MKINQNKQVRSNEVTNTNNSDAPFKLGEWIIQPACNELTKPQQTKSIESKAMDTLLYLKANHSKPVSNNELLQFVWKDTVVSENTVRRIITQLRKALEDDASHPEYIKTIPKRGYQLVAQVNPVNVKENSLKAPLLIASFVFLTSIIGFLIFSKTSILDAGVSKNKNESGIIKAQELKQITHLVGYEITPSLSPDGNYMLFAHQPKDETGPRLFWRDINKLGSYPVEGITSNAVNPSWSPDGKHVAYLDFSKNQCQVALAKSTKFGRTLEFKDTIAQCDFNTFSRIVWKNSKEFLFRSIKHSNESARFYQYNIETKEQELVPFYSQHPKIQPSHMASAFFESASPEKEWDVINPEYAYIIPNGFNSDLWIKRVNTEDKFIQQIKGNVRAIRYCGKEQTLTIVQKDTIWTKASTNLSSQKRLIRTSVNLPKNITHFSCSSASDRSVFSARQLTSNIIVNNNPLYVQNNHKQEDDEQDNRKKNNHQQKVTDNSFKGHNIRPSTGSNGWPSFANNSNSLAFVSDRDKKWEIFISSEGDLTKVSIPDQIELQGYPFIWSPDDSKALVMQSNQDLSIYNKTNNSFKTVASAKDNIFTLEWAFDGKGIYYVPLDSREIWHLDLDSGKRKSISKVRATDIVSVDKNTLYFTKSDEHGLWRLNLETLGITNVIAELHNLSQFRVFEKGIYFNKAVDQPMGLFYYSFDTKNRVELFTENKEEYGHQFTISHDQKLIAYAKYEDYQADIYQVDN